VHPDPTVAANYKESLVLPRVALNAAPARPPDTPPRRLVDYVMQTHATRLLEIRETHRAAAQQRRQQQQQAPRPGLPAMAAWGADLPGGGVGGGGDPAARRSRGSRPCSAGLCSQLMACGLCSATRGHEAPTVAGGPARPTPQRAQIDWHTIRGNMARRRAEQARVDKAQDALVQARVESDRVAAEEHWKQFSEANEARRRVLLGKIATVKPDSTHHHQGHQGPVTCVITLLDGRPVSASSGDCRIIVWTANTKRKSRILQHELNPIFSLATAVNAGAEVLAAGSNRTVLVYTTSNWALARVLPGHQSYVGRLPRPPSRSWGMAGWPPDGRWPRSWSPPTPSPW